MSISIESILINIVLLAIASCQGSIESISLVRMAEGLYHLLERIGTLLRAASREASGEAGLQPVHLAALDYLARANRYSDTPGAVGEYLGLTKGTVSQSLQVLEREGLIAKRSDPDDKRLVHLAVSGKGKRILRRAVPPEILQEATKCLANVRLTSLEADLSGVLLALQKAHRSRAFGVCHTCRFLISEATGLRCGLTRENLSVSDSRKICREHEKPEPSEALA